MSARSARPAPVKSHAPTEELKAQSHPAIGAHHREVCVDVPLDGTADSESVFCCFFLERMDDRPFKPCSNSRAICAGKSCPKRLHQGVGTRCSVCQRCVGPRRCENKIFRSSLPTFGCGRPLWPRGPSRECFGESTAPAMPAAFARCRRARATPAIEHAARQHPLPRGDRRRPCLVCGPAGCTLQKEAWRQRPQRWCTLFVALQLLLQCGERSPSHCSLLRSEGRSHGFPTENFPHGQNRVVERP